MRCAWRSLPLPGCLTGCAPLLCCPLCYLLPSVAGICQTWWRSTRARAPCRQAGHSWLSLAVPGYLWGSGQAWPVCRPQLAACSLSASTAAAHCWPAQHPPGPALAGGGAGGGCARGASLSGLCPHRAPLLRGGRPHQPQPAVQGQAAGAGGWVGGAGRGGVVQCAGVVRRPGQLPACIPSIPSTLCATLLQVYDCAANRWLTPGAWAGGEAVWRGEG